jgi:hypothetical protein
LLQSQTLITRETQALFYGSPPSPLTYRASRPELQAIVDGLGDPKQPRLGLMFALTRWCHRIPAEHPDLFRSTLSGYYGDFSAFNWGGSEEYVISKGSPWPQELARVLATLLQLAGIPARVVFLYRAAPPLLHTVVEARPQETWSVCDPCVNRCYIWPHHGYASALELQQHPQILVHAPEHGRHPYVDADLYKTAAIAEYPLADRPNDEIDVVASLPEQRGVIELAASALQNP